MKTYTNTYEEANKSTDFEEYHDSELEQDEDGNFYEEDGDGYITEYYS